MKNDSIVRIWMYEYDADQEPGLSEFQDLIMSEIFYYAEANNVRIEFVTYSSKEMSEEDYMLKRNLALEHGDADIIIGDMYSMHQISKFAADYTILTNYANIFDNFKGQPFIPIGSLMSTMIINNRVMNIYGIKSDKYITLDEYYEIKQQLKASGARFKYVAEERDQLYDYYASKKDSPKMVEENGIYTIDRDTALEMSQEIARELRENYIVDISSIKEEIKSGDNRDRIIYDKTSGYTFAQRGQYYPLKFLSFTYDVIPPFDDYTVVIENDFENIMFRMPCMIINKNTRKDDTYKITDFIISEKFQRRLYNNTLAYSTIIDTPQLRHDSGYNDDRSYKYEPGKTKIYNQRLTGSDIKELILVVQEAYEIFKNTDTEKYISEVYNNGADIKGVELHNRYYEILHQKDISNIFISRELRETVPNFIIEEIEGIIKQSKIIKQPEQRYR